MSQACKFEIGDRVSLNTRECAFGHGQIQVGQMGTVIGFQKRDDYRSIKDAIHVFWDHGWYDDFSMDAHQAMEDSHRYGWLGLANELDPFIKDRGSNEQNLYLLKQI